MPKPHIYYCSWRKQWWCSNATMPIGRGHNPSAAYFDWLARVEALRRILAQQ